MARIPSPPLPEQLATIRTVAEQNVFLRKVKNSIIGHAHKKEQWVQLGFLEFLAEVLVSPSTAEATSRGTSDHTVHISSERHQVRLQAVELLSIFASGGPTFLAPLHAAQTLPAILKTLNPHDTHPKIILACLRALLNIARSSLLADPQSTLVATTVADIVFSSPYIERLSTIVVSPSSSWISVSQGNVATKLISLLCCEERHQMALADAGMLDALATRLASFVAAQGCVVPGAEVVAQNDGIADCIPAPAAAGADLGGTLEAIAALVAESRLRACMLLYSPSILAVFPRLPFSAAAPDISAAWKAFESGGLSNPLPWDLSALDHILPAVPSQHLRITASQINLFPPLGTTLHNSALPGPSLGRRGIGQTGLPEAPGSPGSTEETESPLIAWLIMLVRTNTNYKRIMAAFLLTSLYRAGFVSRDREAALGLLIVPPVMQMLAELETPAAPTDSSWRDSDSTSRWSLTERSLIVLARLATDSEFLQKCAYDCQALKILSKLFKALYGPLAPRSDSRPWRPVAQKDLAEAAQSATPARTMGPDGQHPFHARQVKLREAALKAIAAMVSFKDEYRKSVIAPDVVCCVVESLSATPFTPPAVGSPYGTNPTGVLIAACHCVRMLSRSVSIVRTALEDAGVSEPIFELLRHPDLDVQIAATAAVCNLVTEVSPMRPKYLDEGIMKIVCDHARSLNAALRLNAVWALKHLVTGLAPAHKRACLEELQPGWLVQLICDDTEDEALFAKGQGDNHGPSAAGDLGDIDVDMDHSAGGGDGQSLPSASFKRAINPRTIHERSKIGRLRDAESKIATLRDVELNPVRKARNDDIAIQEQGLNFIRNLIGPSIHSEPNDVTEMVDYLFGQLGQDRFFEILTAKLRPKVLRPFSRRFSAGRASKLIYPKPKVVEAVIFILVHISASVPRHRQLVISQTDMLKALAAHFLSKDKEVRVSLCHLLSNLTWRDNGADSPAASQRALELKRLGLMSKLEAMEQEDYELDVRERAKLAIHQMHDPEY